MLSNTNEIWFPVHGFEGLYEISNFGRCKPTVSRYKSVEFLKTRKNRGYERVTLYKNGKRKDYFVHVLVAKAFIPNPNNKPQVNHIDGDKANNHTSNLEWVTQSENQIHAKMNGLDPSTLNNPRQSTSVDMFSLDGGFIKTFPSISEVERQLHINQGNISKCCAGKTGFKTAGGFVWKYHKEECKNVHR